MEKLNKNNFTEGSIFGHLVKFVLPLIFALVMQAMYSTVDLIIVGKFGDTASVAGVATGGQIMHLVTVIVTGLTMGLTVKIGQYVGAKDNKKLADSIGASIFLFGIVTIVVTIIMLVFTKDIARMMKVPEQAVSKCIDYVVVCSIGTVFIVAYNVISGIFRGLGDSKTPLIFIIVACVINIIADIILVAFFKLDALGAGIATVFAQAMSVLFSLILMKHRGLPFKFSKSNIRFNKSRLKSILKIGAPIALQDALTTFSFLIITAIVNGIGLVESASIGIAEKTFIILGIIPMSFMSAISAIVAQNKGAGFHDRAFEVLKVGMKISIFFGIASCALSFFAGSFLASLFENNPDVIYATSIYLKGSSIEYLIISITFCMIGYYNGYGKSTFNMLQSLLTAFLLRIPLSYIFSIMEGTTMFHIGLAVPISAFASLIACTIYLFFVKPKKKQLHPKIENDAT